MPQHQGADKTEPVRSGSQQQSYNYSRAVWGEFFASIDLIVISCWGSKVWGKEDGGWWG